MPAASMFRAALRLSSRHRVRVPPEILSGPPPQPPIRLRHDLAGPGLLLSSSVGAGEVERHASNRIAQRELPPAPTDEARDRHAPGHRERRKSLKEKATKGIPRGRQRHASRSQHLDLRRGRPRPRSKTHITWARVHDRRWRDSSTGPDHLRRLRGMHFQWGFLRHLQAPPGPGEAGAGVGVGVGAAAAAAREELVSRRRRRFNSWKTKFHNILAARSTAPYAWAHAGSFLFQLDTVPDMRRAWSERDTDMDMDMDMDMDINLQRRREQWPLVMLSTLYSCPDKADLVLEATLDPLPPGYAILDVLTFVARRLRLDLIKDPRQCRLKAEQTFDLVARIVQYTPRGHMPLGQRAMGLFARKLPADLASELYAVLQRSPPGHSKLHPNTRMHFARSLAGHLAHKQEALEILAGLAHEGVDLNSPTPQSVITALLHARPDHEGWSDETASSFSPRDVLETLMHRGFSPNHITATALLDSLCHQHAVDDAIRLALLFAESGVALDTKAWATVVRGAKHGLNIAHVVRCFDVARAANVPLLDVLNNALHSVYFFADAESRQAGAKAPWIMPLFEPMLYLYAQRFDLEPLQRWLPDSLPLLITSPTGFDEDRFAAGSSTNTSRGRYPWRFLQTIVPAVNDFFALHKQAPRARPSTTTVAIMLRAYIRTLKQPYDLLSYYAFFKARLEEAAGSGFPAQLIRDQGSLIHDTIIMTMLERKGLSRPALQVFGDMLRDHLSSSSDSDSNSDSDSDTKVHPPPSLCTYSILIRGLALSDRILASQIRRVMREQGIAPDLVTWNTLVRGFAAVQDVGRTVQTLRDMEAAGFRPDLFTFRAFGRLKDQGRALEMMEGIIQENRMAGGEATSPTAMHEREWYE